MKYLQPYNEYKGYNQIGDLKTWNLIKYPPRDTDHVTKKKEPGELVDEDEIEDTEVPYQLNTGDHIKTMAPTNVKIKL